MENEEKEIILRSEEVNEILTKPPVWLIRWGISIVFITIVIGLVLSYFIEYPDSISASAVITTLNPPATIVSKSDGKLSYLLVANNQSVKKDQVLAVLENTGNYEEIISLELSLDVLINKIKLTDTTVTPCFADVFLKNRHL